MPTPSYFTYPAFGSVLSDQSHYSQAVRIGDRIEVSGQGGWDSQSGKVSSDLAEEIDQALANIELAVKTAGGEGISQVYRLNAYITVLDEELMAVWPAVARKWFPNHRPLLTAVGVSKLALPGMRIEIEAAAYSPEGGQSK